MSKFLYEAMGVHLQIGNGAATVRAAGGTCGAGGGRNTASSGRQGRRRSEIHFQISSRALLAGRSWMGVRRDPPRPEPQRCSFPRPPRPAVVKPRRRSPTAKQPVEIHAAQGSAGSIPVTASLRAAHRCVSVGIHPGQFSRCGFLPHAPCQPGASPPPGGLAGLGARVGSTTGCSPLRFAPFCVAFRSCSPGGGSSLTRLVSGRLAPTGRTDRSRRVPPQAVLREARVRTGVISRGLSRRSCERWNCAADADLLVVAVPPGAGRRDGWFRPGLRARCEKVLAPGGCEEGRERRREARPG